MCKNLVEKGDLDKPLIIFNRTNKRSTDLLAKLPQGKSHVAESLQEAVSKADIIFTCLGDDAAIKDTIASAAKDDVQGKLFVDCSTVHPDTTTTLAKSLEAHGARFVACPGQYPNQPQYSGTLAEIFGIQFSGLQLWPTVASSFASLLVPHLMWRRSSHIVKG